MKLITLRFFDVEYSTGLTSSFSLVKKVVGKLSSAASERMMAINQLSSDKFDLISNYSNFANGTAIAGTCLRITNSKLVPVISDEILRQQQFSISAINEKAQDDEKTCLDYFYFCLSDKHLIITLDKRGSIKRFETYINWLLNTSETGDYISFTPIIDKQKLSIADVKKITIDSKYNIPLPNNLQQQQSEPSLKSKVVSLAGNVLMSLISDTSSLGELMEANICSANLVIKFAKPRSMSKEDYIQKTAGIILKPMDDPEGIKFVSNGKKITGTQALLSEDISVDCDTDGALSEQNVYQEMFKKIRKL